MSNRIVFCPDCREPFRAYSHAVVDQTYCPECRADLERRVREKEERNRNRGTNQARYP